MLIPNRFTEDALEVLKNSKEISCEFYQEFIGSEHLLLALINKGSDIIINNNADIEFKMVYKILNDAFSESITNNTDTSKLDNNTFSFTPDADRILKCARDLQKRYRSNAISLEFLWIALLSVENTTASKILSALNINVDSILQDFYSYVEANINSMPQDSEEAEKFSLEKYTIDLTKKAENNQLDKIVGRRNEINRIIQILGRKTKNNPILVGEPGVGKTAIVEGLSQEIANSFVPDFLKNKKILALDLSSVVAGSKYRGEFEDRLKKIINKIREDGDTIIFIDEIHTLIGAGGAEGTLDAANILKPSLARGEIQCIGATTVDEYRKYFEKDKALERRFEEVKIDEPSTDESIEILRGIKSLYEKHHHLLIDDDALVASVKLSKRYIQHKFLPDKAINIMDETASRIRMEKTPITEEYKGLIKKLKELQMQKGFATIDYEYEAAAEIRDSIKKIKTKINKYSNKHTKENLTVKASDVEKTVSNITGINIEKLTSSEGTKLANLEKLIHKRIKGQDEAVNAISKAIRRSRAGLNDPNRPIGSFMFLGPTGVGKTELCRVLNDILFDSDKSFIKIDMSEYMEKHSVSKLIGSPPGYVGYDEGGQLTNKVRKNPYSLILFDEIEKAHPDVFNILLQVLEDGELSDSEGRKIDFRNTIIIMTSNAGAHDIANGKNLGFGNLSESTADYAKMKKNVMDSVKEIFRPEFINRIDELIVFHSLNKKNIKEIIVMLLEENLIRLKDRNISLKVTPAVYNYILEHGYSNNFGARPLKRLIQTEIIDTISENVIKGQLKDNSVVKISVKDKKLNFEYL